MRLGWLDTLDPEGFMPVVAQAVSVGQGQFAATIRVTNGGGVPSAGR